MRKLAPVVALTNEQPVSAWEIGEQSRDKPLAKFGSASMKLPISEGRRLAEVPNLPSIRDDLRRILG